MAQEYNFGEMDPMRMFKDMKFPAMPDMEALMATYKRNMEVLSAANRVALEGAQAVAKRHMEIMQQTMAELGGDNESPRNRRLATGKSCKAGGDVKARL